MPAASSRFSPAGVVPPLAAARAGLHALPLRLRRHLSGGAYRPEIDGLRFLAIAIVIVGHLAERLVRFFPAAQSATGNSWAGEMIQRPGLGVYLFFAVSGFILASQAERAKAHPLSGAFLKRYFGRRIMRIEPPYLILLLATFAVITATGYSPEGTKQFFVAPQSLAASLGGSIVYAHDLIWGTYPKLFPPGWSLEVEVQFYILAPLFFALWLLCKSTVARVTLGIVGLIGGSLLSLLAPTSIGPAHVETSLLRFLHFFWLGLVLAQAQGTLVRWVARVPAWLVDVAGWGAFVAYVLLPKAPDPVTSADLAVGMAMRAAALASVATMFVAVFAPQSAFRRFCVLPWISLVGGACYSLYLTHLQAIQLMTAIAAKVCPDAPVAAICLLAIGELVAVLVVGLVFYALVERFFMQPDWLRVLRERMAWPFVARATGR